MDFKLIFQRFTKNLQKNYENFMDFTWILEQNTAVLSCGTNYLLFECLNILLENRCKIRKYLPNKISNWPKDAKWWWTKWNEVQGHTKDNHTGLTIKIIQI